MVVSMDPTSLSLSSRSPSSDSRSSKSLSSPMTSSTVARSLSFLRRARPRSRFKSALTNSASSSDSSVFLLASERRLLARIPRSNSDSPPRGSSPGSYSSSSGMSSRLSLSAGPMGPPSASAGGASLTESFQNHRMYHGGVLSAASASALLAVAALSALPAFAPASALPALALAWTLSRLLLVRFSAGGGELAASAAATTAASSSSSSSDSTL
mmetsp:Transcript_12111/g.34261  ORF Transcript_12111/g.34261 Transcript_12111/m.34261 type:complete len:213 (-) Transcript_12111:47-685(-)